MEHVYSPLIEQAIELAASWHDRTYRKMSWRVPAFEIPEGELWQVPVIAHVTMVAMTVQRAGWDEATVAAAFLHDTIEDANRFNQSFLADQLRQTIGDRVTDLVLEVTEIRFDAFGQWRSWKRRKEDYVAHLYVASPEAVAISLADKMHNLWSMNETLVAGTDIFNSGPGRKGLSAGPDEQVWFHRAVLAASEQQTDARLQPLRASLERELDRFERLIRESPNRH